MGINISLGQKVSFLAQYYSIWQLRKLYFRIFKDKLRSKHYAGKIVSDCEAGNKMLHELIKDGKSFMAGRFGSIELSAMAEVVRSICLNKEYDYNRLKDLNMNAGFVGTEKEEYREFVELMIRSVSACDVMGVWYNQMEDWFCREYMPSDFRLTHRKVYDFWNYEKPFTDALKDKKVLVIHPYTESINRQYARRDKIFANKYILPEFELKTVKAVQTIAGQRDSRFETWFDALEYMYNEAMKEDFDIALIGCGAYGYPLAAKLKEHGKMAIHMGGVLQILFGIKGKRWDDIPEVRDLYNEYWVRPNESERVENANMIENACYW